MNRASWGSITNRIIVAFSVLGLLVACNTEEQPPKIPDYPVKISPTITKVTETNFELGDAIGLTVIREGGVWVENANLTFDGSAFVGDTKWYNSKEASTLKAYYPYSAILPSSFTVALDQRSGTTSSDFVAAVKSGVVPSAEAVPMVFSHKFCRIIINMENQADKSIEGVVLGGSVPTATVSENFEIEVANGVPAADIQAFKVSDNQYRLITVPQTVSFTVTVKADGVEQSKTLASVDLKSGKEYQLSVVVQKDDIVIVLSGEINNWNDGGDIAEGEKVPVPDGAVDLGLSVYWASCNLGAESPEGYGDYFAWGEVNPKVFYDWEHYKWCDPYNNTAVYTRCNSLTKYNDDNAFGDPDYKTTLDRDDDAAAYRLGGDWRMPTWEEWQELFEQCSWEWSNGGYFVSGNGNSIFLPAAGFKMFDSSISGIHVSGIIGYYWIPQIGSSGYADHGGCIYFSQETKHYDIYGKYHGFSIRPVFSY